MNPSRAAVAALAVAAVTTLSPPAVAEGRQVDHRPCVSIREYHGFDPGIGVQGIPGLHGTAFKLRALEERWEVVGRRLDVIAQGRRHFIQYEACGFNPDEVSVWVQTTTRGDHPLRKEIVDLAWRERRDPDALPQGYIRTAS